MSDKKNKKNDEIAPELKEILSTSSPESSDILRRTTQQMRMMGANLNQDKIQDGTEEVLKTSRKAIEHTTQALKQITAQKKETNPEVETLLRETMRLKNILENQMDYIESLSTSASKTLDKKKKSIFILKIVAVVLLFSSVSVGAYYQFLLSPKEKLEVQEYLWKEYYSIISKKQEELQEKEKQIGETTEELAKKKKEVAEAEKKVQETSQKLTQTEQKINLSQKQIREKEQKILESQRQLLNSEKKVVAMSYSELGKKAEGTKEKFEQLKRELGELRLLFYQNKQNSQLFVDNIESIGAKIFLMPQHLDKESILQIQQPAIEDYSKKVNLIQTTLKELEKGQGKVENLIQTVSQSHQQIIKSDKNFDSYKIDYQKFATFIQGTDSLLDIYRKVTEDIQSKNKVVCMMMNEYYSARIFNFKNLEEIMETLDTLSKSRQELESSNKEVYNIEIVKKLEAEKNNHNRLQQKLQTTYQEYINLSLSRSRNLASILNEMAKNFELLFIAMQEFKLEKTIENKLDSLQTNIQDLQKSIVEGESDFTKVFVNVSQINSEITQSAFSLNEIKSILQKKAATVVVEPIEKSTPTTSPVATSPSSLEPTFVDIQKNFDQIYQLFSLSPLEFILRASFYKKGVDDKFKIVYQTKIRVKSLIVGIGKEQQRFFVGKTLTPKEDYGKVLLRKDDQFWYYDNVSGQIGRLASTNFAQDGATDHKSRLLDITTRMNYVNLFLYSMEAPLEMITVNDTKVYTVTLKLIDPDENSDSYVKISLVTNTVDNKIEYVPVKMDFLSNKKEVLRTIFFRKYQESEIGKKIQIIEVQNAKEPDYIFQLSYSDLKKKEFPTYLFDKSQMANISREE